jgi:hypothetical protein
MAQYSVYRVRWSMTNAGGKSTAGPYTTNVGVSGGSRGEIQSGSVTSSLATAISNNLLSILQAHGFGGSAGPGGTVTIDSYDHAAAPDVWA